MPTLTTSQPNNSSEKTGSQQNIFEKPIVRGKTRMEQRKEAIKSKNIKKGYTYLIFAVVALVAYSVAFLYPQTTSFLKAPGQISQFKDEIKNYDNVVLPSLEKEKNMHKTAYEEDVKNIEQALNKVFPQDISKYEIVKTLENFATSIHSTTPPFEFNSVSFSKPEQGTGYTILPMSTSIHSSTVNFDRFLQLINVSGRLNAEVPVRLMDISNINISYRGLDPNTGEDKGVDFSVKLNAYSR